ncbi:hypothetical protein DS745_22440 [Anaerobacillus alkaliphilus]|uniref:HipA-like kinase domain-containing protein n=1 Tax=Anaerobacillus alkaliphilus TaxID=1548597 RepID=A0A4Q0VNQ5_9BACI|nr:HipA family kinase [Anaerobacillus alkaliphilus]RXI96472.1 hypothetical protein DS745_22440 [Anaerobacillus alkaliphilus]
MVLKAVEHINEVGEGFTNPQIIKCEDGQLYVVKFLHPHIRKKSLPNELIAYGLGQYIALPMPRCSLIYVSEELIQSSPLKALNVSPGIHFASHFQERTKKVSDKYLLRCANRNKIADMLVFDIWVDNRDRKKNNLLIAKDERKLNLLCIDHDYIMGGKNWTLEDLRKYDEDFYKIKWGRSQNMLIKHVADPNHLITSANKLKSLNASQIKTIVDVIPEEWNVSSEERHALVSILNKRKEGLLDVITKIIKQHY